MKGYVENIEVRAVENTHFREVVYTGKSLQLVVMSLMPGEEIGLETHVDTDQFFRVEKGRGKAIIDGTEYPLTDGSAVFVPQGAKHNIVNMSETDALKLYTLYAPSHHKDGTVHAVKADALNDTEEFDGVTTE